MAAINNLSPEQLRAAQQQMSNMSPETLQQQAASYSNHLKGEQTYKINASKQLKNEGNTLHASGNFEAAMAKYQRALDNLARTLRRCPSGLFVCTYTHFCTLSDITTAEAKELARSCTLNLSSCTLNLRDYPACIAHCNAVLDSQPTNVKALYRRGQAYLHTSRHSAAVADLQKAMDGSPANQKEVCVRTLCCNSKSREETAHVLDPAV